MACLPGHITSNSNLVKTLLGTRFFSMENGLKVHWVLLSVRTVSRRCWDSGRKRRRGSKDSTRISRPGLREVERDRRSSNGLVIQTECRNRFRWRSRGFRHFTPASSGGSQHLVPDAGFDFFLSFIRWHQIHEHGPKALFISRWDRLLIQTTFNLVKKQIGRRVHELFRKGIRNMQVQIFPQCRYLIPEGVVDFCRGSHANYVFARTASCDMQVVGFHLIHLPLLIEQCTADMKIRVRVISTWLYSCAVVSILFFNGQVKFLA